jgi:hypothetical protein
MTHEECKALAIVRAVKKAVAQASLKVGDIFAHPDERLAGRVEEINGEVLVGSFPGDRREKFPLGECFDPNVAMGIARGEFNEIVKQQAAGHFIVVLGE